MKVIILGAGQGKRLLPLTADVPKALLDIGGRPLIERQIEAFRTCGIDEIVVVTGYAAHRMDKALRLIADRLKVTIRTVYNPFYSVADNLASCWMARHEMQEEFIQVNGDNVFRASLVERLLAAPEADAIVAINHKNSYDTDDMKVMLDGERLTEIAKNLPLEAVDAEAIGFYVFRGTGARQYAAKLDAAMRDPAGLKQWFPAAVGELAKEIEVRTVTLDGIDWCEVDFPSDLQKARQMVAGW